MPQEIWFDGRSQFAEPVMEFELGRHIPMIVLSLNTIVLAIVLVFLHIPMIVVSLTHI